MRRSLLFTTATLVSTLGLGCTDGPVPTDPSAQGAAQISPFTAGMTQISGIGYFAEPGQCNDPQGLGSSYGLIMTGDLQGCHYIFVETARCSAGGAYKETGTETFVGLYSGAPGTFRTTYSFTATYRDCANLLGEIAGRCEHPIVAGSGEGVFEGVTGRFDMKDDVVAGNFPYRGHLQFPVSRVTDGPAGIPVQLGVLKAAANGPDGAPTVELPKC